MAQNNQKILNWLADPNRQQLQLTGAFSSSAGPLGWTAWADGTINPATNLYTVVLTKGTTSLNQSGYYVSTAYPNW